MFRASFYSGETLHPWTVTEIESVESDETNIKTLIRQGMVVVLFDEYEDFENMYFSDYTTIGVIESVTKQKNGYQNTDEGC